MQNDAWHEIARELNAKIAPDDDFNLWRVVCETVYRDAAYLCRSFGYDGARSTLGCCSRWLRPHQTRWSADGGFAWPAGYDGPSSSRVGLPEHDWALPLVWDPELDTWRKPRTDEPKPRIDLEFWVSVPARSARHEQAAVHTIWRPAMPVGSGREVVQFYGFRRQEGTWSLTASSFVDEVYELAAEQAHPTR